MPGSAALTAFLLAFFTVSVYGGQSTVPPVVDAVRMNRQVVVVIDAGHGGGEWGISVKGVQEKNITLELAKKLAEKLKGSGKNIKVVMTRIKDEFLTADVRAGTANAAKGDIFISIHCDYVPVQGAEGYRLYYMRAEAGQVITQGGLKLWPEVQFAHAGKSARLAAVLSRYLKAALIAESGNGDENDLLSVPSRGEMSVNSNVLAGVDMPAVIFEAGNLNNTNDINALRDTKTLDQMAYHMKEGIINFIIEQGLEAGRP